MRSVTDLPVAGRRVLLRTDFNVPLDHTSGGTAVITDDGRISAALPTIEWLRSQGARIVIVAHLGRPKGAHDPALSLRPVATRLKELLGVDVPLGEDISGPKTSALVNGMADGDVLLLENIRFDARETSKDPGQRGALAHELASLADVYVSEGFGVVHREQASVTDVARLLPSAAGLLVARESAVFTRLLTDPDRPFVVVLGGSKVSDKLGVIENLIDRVDCLLIGGGMAFTFLAGQGLSVGDSLLEPDEIEATKRFVARARDRGVALLLPVDIVVADDFRADAQVRVVPASEIPDGWRGLDIGPATARLYSDRIGQARTVVWNGPMGVFEMPPFAVGTRAVAEAMASASAFTVIGGGDSAAAVRAFGLGDDRFDHISTGGGASLEFLEGKDLPGLAVLKDPGLE